MYFEEILGDKVYTPMIDVYLQKLHSATTAQQKPSLPECKTPSFLRIVASPDDDQAKCLVLEMGRQPTPSPRARAPCASFICFAFISYSTTFLPILFIFYPLGICASDTPIPYLFYIYIYVLAETPLSRLSTERWGELTIRYLYFTFYLLYLAIVT